LLRTELFRELIVLMEACRLTSVVSPADSSGASLAGEEGASTSGVDERFNLHFLAPSTSLNIAILCLLRCLSFIHFSLCISRKWRSLSRWASFST